MARNENPPFARGATFYEGATIDSNNLGGINLEGQEWVFEDIDLNAAGSTKKSRTGLQVTCRIVRNVSGIALLPKRAVRYQATAGNYGGRVDGYTTTTAAPFAGVVDEYLPSTGVPANDLFWIVVKGPTLMLPDLAAGANNVINIGDALVALTAATSQATTAGRVAPQDLTGATAPLANQVQNKFGHALTARTTANTTLDVLVNLRQW
jgi:hypothetical protein